MLMNLLIDLLDASFATHGPRPMLTQGGRSYTYREIDKVTREIGDLLETHGRTPVAVMDREDVASRVAYIAVIRSGRVVVPLSSQWPLERVEVVLAESGAGVVIDTDTSREQHDTQVILGELGLSLRVRKLTTPERTRAESLSRSDVAYVLFTSGSTGRPKGVPISVGSVCAFIKAVLGRFAFTSADVFSATFRLTFDVSVFDILIPLVLGARSALPSTRSEMLDISSYIRASEITVWFSVPSTIEVGHRLGSLSAGALQSLKHSLFIGERLSTSQAALWRTATSGAPLHNVYGPTEATVACMSFELSNEPSSQARQHGSVPIGVPFDGMRYRIGSARDPRELLISGTQVFDGYLDSEADAEAFEHSADTTWYRTGDQVLVDGGELFCLGRVDRQVKINGYRVELTEVESAFLRAGYARVHALIEERGDGSPALTVYVAGEPSLGVSIDRIRATLPKYMWPNRLRLVNDVPLNANGKADLPALHRRERINAGVR